MMNRILASLSGLLLVVVGLSACGASTPTATRAATAPGKHLGNNAPVATTEPPSTTLATIPPAPAAATPVMPGATSASGTENGSCPSAPNVAVTAVPDTTLNNLFQTYGDIGKGTTWTGGDGTESISLGNRELWFFADSYLGKIKKGVWLRGGSHFLHNSLVVERKGQLTRTLHKGRKSAPTAFFSPMPQDPSNRGFWPGPMLVNGSTLQVLGLDIQFTPGSYVVLGNSLVTFALPSLRVLGLQELPPSATDWSGGVLRDGGYTYMYGTAGSSTYSARVQGTNLAAPWSYYDGSGWSPDQASAAPIETIGTKSHFSVSRVGSLYVFIAKSTLATTDITAAFGCSPVGPFGPPQTIYSTPESSQFPPGDGVVTYGAFAHPELSTTPNTLVVSYDVNAQGPTSRITTDASIYRPRFIDVSFTPQ